MQIDILFGSDCFVITIIRREYIPDPHKENRFLSYIFTDFCGYSFVCIILFFYSRLADDMIRMLKNFDLSLSEDVAFERLSRL